jgi:hypothetical protein
MADRHGTPAQRSGTRARRTGASPNGAGADGARTEGGAARARERPAREPPRRDGGLLQSIGEAVSRRIPRADLDLRDPDYIREQLPGLWLFASFYHRAQVRGLHNIPAEGPVLLVGNHSGGNVIVDTFVFTLAFNTYFGVERRFYQLAHNLVLLLPGLARLRRFGTVAASPENAETALRTGAVLLVYPGGDWETHRPSWQSGRIDFGGRTG